MSTTLTATGGTERAVLIQLSSSSSHCGDGPAVSPRAADRMASCQLPPPPEAKSLLSFLQGWLVGETGSTLCQVFWEPERRCLPRSSLLAPAVEIQAKCEIFLWVNQAVLTRTAIY